MATDHAHDHSDHAARFCDRFWISLVLAVPVVAASPMFADLLGYTPTVRKALPLVSEETKKWMPDMTNPRNVVSDDKWWQPRFAALQKRYAEWLLT